MVDTFKRWLKIAAGIAVIYAGIQFSMVYINRLQLSHIMDSEALDARRHDDTAHELETNIRNRAVQTSVYIPDDIEFDVTVSHDRSDDIVVIARYTDWVDLVVREIPVDVEVVAVAEPPIR